MGWDMISIIGLAISAVLLLGIWRFAAAREEDDLDRDMRLW